MNNNKVKIYCLNNISKQVLENIHQTDEIVDNINECDAVIVRSYEMKDMALNDNVYCVARAGAGVNNIPYNDYAKQGIVVFNTPGANANAVKELVIAGILLSSRDIIGGINWIKDNINNIEELKKVESIKKQFAGFEIYKKTILVIGLGAIGVMVANACVSLGMNVIGYDPFLNTNNALKLDSKVKYVSDLKAAVKEANYITIHVPATSNTNKMINEELINLMNENTVLLNFSRDALVDEETLLKKPIKKYVTDFVNETTIKMSNAIVLPHLGASTKEAEDNSAYLAFEEIKDYMENGNIKNSVNYPSLNASKKQGKTRICLLHKNVPGVINKFTNVLYEIGANILTLVNQSKGDYAYTILDIDKDINKEKFNHLRDVIRVRII